MVEIHRSSGEWLPISVAPSEGDLEVCVIDRRGTHALVFPCRKNGNGWVDPSTKLLIEIQPTHWRPWGEDR
jgi:hypothetical protein